VDTVLNITDSALKLAQENEIEQLLPNIKGSGKDGKITQPDIKKFLEENPVKEESDDSNDDTPPEESTHEEIIHPPVLTNGMTLTVTVEDNAPLVTINDETFGVILTYPHIYPIAAGYTRKKESDFHDQTQEYFTKMAEWEKKLPEIESTVNTQLEVLKKQLFDEVGKVHKAGDIDAIPAVYVKFANLESEAKKPLTEHMAIKPTMPELGNPYKSSGNRSAGADWLEYNSDSTTMKFVGKYRGKNFMVIHASQLSLTFLDSVKKDRDSGWLVLGFTGNVKRSIIKSEPRHAIGNITSLDMPTINLKETINPNSQLSRSGFEKAVLTILGGDANTNGWQNMSKLESPIPSNLTIFRK